MVDKAVEASSSFAQKVKNYLNPTVLWEKIKESKSIIIDVALFFGLGILVGYFLKKYGQYVVVLLFLIAALIVLQYMNVLQININWVLIQDTLGIAHTNVPAGASLMALYWEWVKINVAIVLSFSIGFLIGLQIA